MREVQRPLTFSNRKTQRAASPSLSYENETALLVGPVAAARVVCGALMVGIGESVRRAAGARGCHGTSSSYRRSTSHLSGARREAADSRCGHERDSRVDVLCGL